VQPILAPVPVTDVHNRNRCLGSPRMGTEVSLDIIQLIIAGRKLVGVADGWSVPQILIPRLLDLWRQQVSDRPDP
jgi:Zn-dependent alcohol dehydrogenase